MSTYTITLGDRAELHVGNEIIGELATSGFSIKELDKAAKLFEQAGYPCELILLHERIEEQCEPAAVLIVRDGVRAFTSADALFDEQEELQYDRKALMYGQVRNKRARHNICFGPKSQTANYAKGQGTVIAFDSLPVLNTVRNGLCKYLGDKAKGLVGEGNHYFDVEKCGIGFHGDSERRKVIAMRLGNTAPLHYQWFKDNAPIGERVILSLGHGDLYVMSEKATGWDWKKKKMCTLRHAAGCEKYTTIKN